MDNLQAAPARLNTELAQRLPPVASRSEYRRTSRRHAGRDGQRFVVTTATAIQREGTFANADIASLEAIVPGGTAHANPEGMTWPRWSKESAGFMLRFDPPLVYLPRRLEGRERTGGTARVQIYNAKGEPTHKGRMSRRVYPEGYATVRAGDRTYNDCVVLRVESRLSVSWVARIALTEYLWLAPKEGIVRRWQHLRGRILFRSFDDVVEDELVDFALVEGREDEKRGDEKQMVKRANRKEEGKGSDKKNDEEKPADAAPYIGGDCSAIIVYFQPALPQPYLAGAVIQLVDEPDRPRERPPSRRQRTRTNQRAATETWQCDTSMVADKGDVSSWPVTSTRPASTN